MRILVPGATGSVGQQVVEQALERGHQVVAIARNPAPITAIDMATALIDIAERDYLGRKHVYVAN